MQRDRYSQGMDVTQCMECGSPMVFRDGMWQCDNCFSVLAVAPAEGNGIGIDEGVTMADIMEQYQERELEQ